MESTTAAAAAASSNGGDHLTITQQQQQQQQQQQMWMQQQYWMAMQQQQYPAAVMMQQQHQQQQQQQFMYPATSAHYMPYQHMPHHQQQAYMMTHHHQHHHQHQQQHQLSQHQSSSEEDNRTIWIGDLQQWMDEDYLISCFSHSKITSAKVIRNKHTGHSERFGFVEFGSHDAAEKVLQSFNGSPMPNSDQVFRLNWATFGMGDKRTEPGSELSIFVGDLAPDVTDAVLNDTFASKYPSVRGARVVVDPNTGRSKGYGFVRFGDDNERTRAITEMNGMYCSTRAMRIGAATPKKQLGQNQQQQQQYSSQAVVLSGGYASNGAMPQNGQTDGGTSNTTLFVGGLDSEVTDEDLRQSFSQYGEVVSIKIPPGKGCGFVQFDSRSSAENAMEGMTGAIIGKQTVRISWGRNTVNKQFRTDYNNQSNGAYYGRQGYGYAAASNGYDNHQQSVS